MNEPPEQLQRVEQHRGQLTAEPNQDVPTLIELMHAVLLVGEAD
jgi:hypothetical protein